MSAKPDWSVERLLWKQGYMQVAGVDEVGRGPLAGPVIAAAVVFSPTFKKSNLPGLNDSKKLTPLARERLSPWIWTFAEGVGIGIASHGEVDVLGIESNDAGGAADVAKHFGTPCFLPARVVEHWVQLLSAKLIYEALVTNMIQFEKQSLEDFLHNVSRFLCY